MAVLLNVYQDNRKNSNKLFYARVFSPSTLHLSDIADRIEQMCTATKADVMSVLSELVEIMNYELGNSNKILLNDFGYFSVGAKTSGALAKDEWNVTENLKSLHINFRPTMKFTKSTAKGSKMQVASKSLGFGYKFKVLDLVEKPKQEDDGE